MNTTPCPLSRAALLCCIAIITIFGSLHSNAQQLGNRGREFWITFLPNSGSDGVAEISDLYLYISSSRPQQVTITHTLTGTTTSVELSDTRARVELNRWFHSLEPSDVYAPADEISARSIHIRAEEEITVSGANLRSKSADAFLALPVEALTGRYLVLAYPNGYAGQFPTNGGFDMPSQFAVVATADSTTVTIIPAPGLTINRRSSDPFTITLQRGQVFLAQADLRDSIPLDVTGTRVEATRPVAVFAGTKRTSVPMRLGNFRDYLVEQLPPVERWSSSALVVPHAAVTQSQDTSVVRIIATRPNTLVQVTTARGQTSYTAEPTRALELPLRGPTTIQAQGPILAAQYEHSGGGSFEAPELGDPFMMLSLAPEQFTNTYTFYSAEHPNFTGGRHFINIIAGTEAPQVVVLDRDVVQTPFDPIPGSNVGYVNIEVTPGWHSITSSAPFGLYVYGYGPAISYGYPGGMMFDPNVASVGEERGAVSSMSLALRRFDRANNSAELEIALVSPERIGLDVVDMCGASALRIADDLALDAGTHHITADLSTLPQGGYFVRLVSRNNVRGVQINVVR